MVELSSLDVRALAVELRSLEDAFVDKVYQTGPDEFVLKLRHPQSGPAQLVLRPGAYAARATTPADMPETPSTLAMTLRKHLGGARVRRVEQHEFDRVLRIQLERKGEPFELVVELFGKGNLILAGPDGRILLAMRTEAFAHRTIRRGEPLVLPPPRVNPLRLARSEFEAMAQKSERDAVRFLAVDLGFGGDLAEELVHRAGVDKRTKAAQLPPAAVDRLWTALRALLDAPPRPAVVTTVNGPRVETIPFEAPLFRDAAREPAGSVSEALLRLALFEHDAAPAAVDEELARLERQVGHQERGITELDEEARHWERRGHLLFAHYATAQHALQKAKATVEARGWAGFAEHVQKPPKTDDPWVSRVAGVDAKRARFTLRLEGEEVPLDPLSSLEQNATILYDEAKRIRAKLENAKAALADGRRRLADRRASDARRTARAAAKPAGRAPAKRFWFEPLRWFWSTEGFLVVGGRDAASNERLVKRHLSTGDRYVHADFHGAPSVVVKGEGATPGEATMREACQFAAAYSRAFAQFAAADAYWVHPEQVSKQAESGEFVPRGAFVVRGARTYVPKVKLEVALGVVHLDKQGRPGGEDAPHARLMGGPPVAVAAYARRVALVERGDQKPTAAAKELAPLLGVTIDEVVAALPSGTVRVVRRPEAQP